MDHALNIGRYDDYRSELNSVCNQNTEILSRRTEESMMISNIYRQRHQLENNSAIASALHNPVVSSYNNFLNASPAHIFQPPQRSFENLERNYSCPMNNRTPQPTPETFMRTHYNPKDIMRLRRNSVDSTRFYNYYSEDSIRSHQNSEDPIRSHHNSEDPIRSHQNSEDPIRSHQNSEDPIRSHQNSETVLRYNHNFEDSNRSHQNSEDPIRHYQNSENTIRSHYNSEDDIRSHRNSKDFIRSHYYNLQNSGLLHQNSADDIRSHRNSVDATQSESPVIPLDRMFSKSIPFRPPAAPEANLHIQEESTFDTQKRRKRSKYCDKSGKVCAICGDVAKSMHFGGMACDSCKAFFRRSVQSRSYEAFICNGQKTCPVIKDNRRICQYCRFEKCLSGGMEVRWVMSEADRMSLWKTKISKHRKTSKTADNSVQEDNMVQENSSIQEDNSFEEDSLVHKESSLQRDSFLQEDQGECPITDLEPIPSNSSYIRSSVMPDQPTKLKLEDRKALEHLETLQDLVFESMPYPSDCDGNTTSSLANLFFCICQKMRSFFFRLDDFREISMKDQPAVLRNGIATSIYLHGAYNYDVQRRTWPDKNIRESLRMPNVDTKTLKLFTVVPEMFDLLMMYYDTYGQCLKDEKVLVLLSLISLFHDSNGYFSSGAFIQNVNNRYICLLRNYLSSIEGEREGNLKLTKLLEGLIVIKKIVSFHRVVDIRYSVDSVKMIRKNTDSLKNQMIAVSFLLTNAIRGNETAHSSVLSAQEKVDIELKKKNQSLSFRRPQYLPDPVAEYLHFHPITNAMFEPNVTDRLFSFGHKNILSMKPSFGAVLAIEQNTKKSDQENRDQALMKSTKIFLEKRIFNKESSLTYREPFQGCSNSSRDHI